MATLKKVMVVQGRKITPADIQLIQQLIADNPSWGRTWLSKELCRLWNWRNLKGQVKDMACRSLLLKLERSDHILLPAPKCDSARAFRNRPIASVPHLTEEIRGSLKTLRPLRITKISPRTEDDTLFNYLLFRYHYLGYKGIVGENIKYLVRSCSGRPLACLLFGSAAWKTNPRDLFIGWNSLNRKNRLNYITNNMRFLILPWVKVPHLASHILSRISRRLSSDWISKYGHPVYLLETFVDQTRFRGVCYRAANWILTGQTKGRTRNDRDHIIKAPVKDVYVYPLSKKFREALCYDS